MATSATMVEWKLKDKTPELQKAVYYKRSCCELRVAWTTRFHQTTFIRLQEGTLLVRNLATLQRGRKERQQADIAA